MNEIGRAISSQAHVNEVLEMIYTQTSRLMDTRNFYIALYDRVERMIKFPIFTEDGTRVECPPRQWSTGVTEWLLHHRRPIRTNTAEFHHDIAPIRYGRASMSYLGVPILLRDEPLGVISVQSPDHANAYSNRDEAILVMIADQAAIAIANAMRYEAVNHELERRIAELEALEATTRDLNATLHLDTVLHRLIERVCATTGADAGMVCMLSDDREHLYVKAALGYPESVKRNMKGWDVQRGITGKVARTGEPDWAPDIRRSAHYEMTRELTLSQLTVPIIHNDMVLGVMALESDQIGAFSAHHLGFVSQIADHAALSIHNANTHNYALHQQALLKKQSQQLNEVLRISHAISANLNLDDLLPEVVQAIQTSLGFNIAMLSLIDKDLPPMVHRRAAVGVPPEQWDLLKARPVPLDWYMSVMRDEFKISRSYFIPHNHDEYSTIWDNVTGEGQVYVPDLGERSTDEWQSADSLFVPLIDTDGKLLGVLSVDDPRDRQRPSIQTIQVLEIFATQAAIAISNANAYEATRQLAITDGLTGLYNQRHFSTLLESEVAIARRHGQTMALLTFDLDKFKSYNDTFGHLEGNVLLREFAQLVRASVRETDIVARNGGEEFAAILPQTDSAGAMLLAERLRATVASHPFPHRPITVSVGVAVLTPGLDTLMLQQAADEALYRSKANGRNLVTMAPLAHWDGAELEFPILPL